MNISKLTFINPVFDNVLLENCTISGSKFLDGRFSNVTFNGGRLTYDERANITLFELCEIDRLTFDRVTMQAARLSHMSGGTIIFRNMKKFSDYGASKSRIVSGSLQLVLENCTVSGTDLARLQDGRVHIIKSILVNSGLSGKFFLYIEDSLLDGALDGYTTIESGKATAVIKNSVLGKFRFSNHGQAYVINNNHSGADNALTSLQTGKLYAADNNIPYLQVSGDEVTLRDMDVQRLSFLDFSGDPRTFNLRNVNIAENLNFRFGANITGGWWENVSIGNTSVTVIDYGDKINISGISAYNLVYNGSNQSLSSSPSTPYTVAIVEKPFTWPEVKVPSAQELGF
jgi:uncharacterized protein YjbI with pentapeptide repeats